MAVTDRRSAAFGTLLAKELLEKVLDLELVAVVVGTTLVGVLVAADQGRRVASRIADHRLAVAEAVRQAERPSTLAQARAVASLPPSPLEVLAEGEAPGQPRILHAARHEWLEPRAYPGPSRPRAASSSFDLSQVVALLIPLLGILLGASVAAGEREKGTLRLLAAAPVPRRVIWASKLAAGAVALAVSMAIFLAAALLSLGAFRGPTLSGEDIAATAVFGLAAWLLGLCYYTVGALLSAASRGVGTALALSLVAWLASSALWPAIAAERGRAAVEKAARSRPPAPNFFPSVELQRRIDTSAPWRRLRAPFLFRTGPGFSVGGIDTEVAGSALVEIAHLFDTALTREADRAEREQRAYRNRVLAAAGSAWMWQSLSPAGLFAQVSQRLADTGPWRWDDAFTAAARSRAAVIAWGDERRIIDNPRFLLIGEPLAPDDFPRQLRVEATSLARRLDGALVPLGALALVSALAAAWGALLFLRYDVR